MTVTTQWITQPLTLGLQFSGTALGQLESVLEVQHRMVRRTALLCQHAQKELAAAPSPVAALGIHWNVVLGTLLDLGKLWSELSLAAAPPLPEPVAQALAESSPPGATPQQVSAWVSSTAQQASAVARDIVSRATADIEAAVTDRPQAATEPKQRAGRKTPRARASAAAARKPSGRR